MKQIFRPVTASRCLLPLYSNSVSAGFPSPASDYEENKIDLNEELIQNPSSTYLVRAQGNSMTGVGIYDGDLLVVDRSLKPQEGSIVIAALHSEFTVKRLQFDRDRFGKRAVLVAENPNYPDLPLQDESAVIWGVVRYAIRDLLK